MANVSNILNTIWDNASENYQNNVPRYNGRNLQDVGNPIITYKAIQNEFLNNVVNKIGLTLVRTKLFNNPLSVLKSGSLPFGFDVEEIYTNPANEKEYDITGQDLLKIERPDTKAVYHRLNRQAKYKVTIIRNMIRQAFTSEASFISFLDYVVNTLYSGDSRDEFNFTKQIYADGINNGKIIRVNVGKLETEEEAKTIVKTIKSISSLFKFPSTLYNSYAKFNPSDTPVETWVEKENQIILMRADVLATLDVDVLAMAFNMDKVEFMSKVIEVDYFPGAANLYGVLMDKSHLVMFDQTFETTDFFNAENMATTYWLHHWQIISMSLLANCVGFVDDSGVSVTNVSIGESTIVIPNPNNYNITAKSSNNNITATVNNNEVAINATKAGEVYITVGEGINASGYVITVK